MKKILLLILALCPILTFSQTIFRVNNTPGITGVNVYSNLQDAHDAASDGDIIYMEPSLQEYPEATLKKRLTIIGNGYFLQDNNIEIEDNLESKISYITLLYDESNPTQNPSESEFYGLKIGYLVAGRVSNVKVERCHVNYLTTYSNSFGCSGWVVKQCYLYNVSGSDGNTTSSNFAFINNLVEYILTGYNFSTITNNTLGFYGGFGPYVVVGNSIISNNIIVSANCENSSDSCNQPTFTGVSNSISNNIIVFDNEGGTKESDRSLPDNNGNVNGADLLSTFRLPNPVVFGKGDFNLQLAASSPAKGIGTGGVDAGAFGGADPYVISGQIPFPIIKNFITTGVGNSAVPLNVNITIAGNN